MTRYQATAAIASEIILWQIKNIAPATYKSTYDFGMAKELAEHLLDQGCSQGVFAPEKITKTDPGQFPGDAFTYETNQWEGEE